jgi:hypothetical protein
MEFLNAIQRSINNLISKKLPKIEINSNLLILNKYKQLTCQTRMGGPCPPPNRTKHDVHQGEQPNTKPTKQNRNLSINARLGFGRKQGCLPGALSFTSSARHKDNRYITP